MLLRACTVRAIYSGENRRLRRVVYSDARTSDAASRPTESVGAIRACSGTKRRVIDPLGHRARGRCLRFRIGAFHTLSCWDRDDVETEDRTVDGVRTKPVSRMTPNVGIATMCISSVERGEAGRRRPTCGDETRPGRTADGELTVACPFGIGWRWPFCLGPPWRGRGAASPLPFAS